MASTIALVADSLSALAPVRVWECLRCGKRWAVDTATGCPYCLRREEELNTHDVFN
ncbi:MAG TPA: hypothetical protein VJV04_14390 [Nitrospiraceae bacterium]|nr:hypothetical protein [Nitrospiraceae bacterium]